MKLDLSQVLLNEKGEDMGKKEKCVIVQEDGKLAKDTDGNILFAHREVEDLKRTLRDVFTECLLNIRSTEIEKPSAKKKVERYDIFFEIKNTEGDVVDLKAEEWTSIQKLIGMDEGPLVYGQCARFIDETMNKDEKGEKALTPDDEPGS